MVRELLYDGYFHFGKYREWRVKEVIDQDPDYFRWLAENEIVQFCPTLQQVLEERKII